MHDDAIAGRHTGSAAPLDTLQANRRSTIAASIALMFGGFRPQAWAQQSVPAPEQRWYEAAQKMRRLAESWGDQSYGAVLVLNGAIVGEGPSRVVKRRDPDAHAEREAIRDAQERLGREGLTGSVLYSTSRPCSLCESAAARAGVARMYFGPTLADAGPPRHPVQ